MKEDNRFSSCLISGSKIIKPIKGYEKYYLVKSQPVGFVFCNKIPTETELIKHYESYPREEVISTLTIERYHELLDKFEKYRKTNKILDVGCGIGSFLEIARERGWDVYGTEFTDEAIAICKNKGVEMTQGKLDTKNYTENMFDIITSFEVIEHINNPIEEVQNMNKLLRPKGLLYFTTPNFNALERYLLRSDYNIIEYPEHLSYYTPKTINYLLTKNGYKKRGCTTTGFSLSRFQKSRNKNGVKAVQTKVNKPVNQDELIRTSLEKNIFGKIMKSSINYLLNLFKMGNSLKGFYEKK